jgi:microcystin-dependent protein
MSNVRNQNQFSFSDLTSNLKLMDVIELGYQPHKTNSGAHSISIGSQTGTTNQGTFGIAIGYQAGQLNQSLNAIAIGTNSGQIQQKPFAIAVGTDAGQNFQGTASIALGSNAGQNQQKINSIAIGTNSGQTNQGSDATALGTSAGQFNQGTNSIALGTGAGQHNQGTNSIAIGTNAGQHNQGTNSISIGTSAGQTNQHSNSIILNASGNPLNSTTSGLFVNPIRNRNDSSNIVLYKPDTFEVIRQPYPVLIGDLKYSLSNIDHNGWLLCDGRMLSIIQYPKLFSLISYSFGGSGGMFALPDPRSRTLGFVGQGAGLSNRTLGQNVGLETHNVSISELPNHTHVVNDPGHLHSFVRRSEFFEFVDVDLDISSIAAKDSYPINISGSSTTGITIDSAGGGQSYSLYQPVLFIGNIFIYSD